METLPDFNNIQSVKTMKETQTRTETHGDFIIDGKYKRKTQIKCAHEGIFWAVMKGYEGRRDVLGYLDKLVVEIEEWVDWRLHPSYQENEQILNQTVKEWEDFLATEEGQAWLKGDEEE